MTFPPSEPSVPRAVPGGRRVSGRATVPPSKSFTHRYLNLALLGGVEVVVERPLEAEDTHLFRDALATCGFMLEARAEQWRLAPPHAEAAGGEIFCGNAGTMLRFLTASLTAVPGVWVLDGTARLRERPVGPLVAALRALGARVECLGREGFAPLRLAGGTLVGGRATLAAAGQSSQYLSALLMAGLRAPRETTIVAEALPSLPYVAVTLAAVRSFGGEVGRRGEAFHVGPGPLRGGRVRVEGDASAACYLAAAAALTGGEVILEGLRADSAQGDRRFFDLLAAMGARVDWGESSVAVAGGGDLRAVDADLSDMPDQVPTLAALAPFARGTTRIRNVPHLRLKESDRLAATAGELRRLGVPAEELPDGLRVPGVWAESAGPPHPVVVDPHGDHRIAMSFCLTGLRRGGVRIAHPEVVAKSYPAFWSDLERLLSG